MRRNWIKNTVLFLGMTMASAALLAQQASAPAPDAAKPNATSSSTAPQLSAEQKKQLRDLRVAARDQAAIIRNDQALTAEQKQAKLKELHTSTRAKMKAVLTPEQQKAFAEHRAAAKADFRAKLGLTPEQDTKMKELFKSTREQRQAVLTNSSLTNEQKQTELRKIREQHKAQLSTILTPEQLAKFQQMRKAHRHGKRG